MLRLIAIFFRSKPACISRPACIKGTVMQIEKVLINYLYFLFISKTLQLKNLKTRTAINAEISVFVICVDAIIHLLLYNLHECTFNRLVYEPYLEITKLRYLVYSFKYLEM